MIVCFVDLRRRMADDRFIEILHNFSSDNYGKKKAPARVLSGIAVVVNSS